MYEQLKIENQLCVRLYTATRLVIQNYRRFLEPLGLTYPQYIVMMALWERDNQPVNEIGARLLLESNTLTPLLKRMEKQGLVVRTHGVADGRRTLVSLTTKGRRLEEDAKEIPACYAQILQCRPFNSGEIVQLAHTLDALINTLRDNR